MSNAPNTRRRAPKPKPFDLNAVIVEAEGAPFVFQFGAGTYEIPPFRDLRVGELLTSGDWSAGIRLLLGQEQWERLCSEKAVLNMDRAIALVNAYAEHLGLSVGESSASSGS